jgi:hypothetical protein
MKTKLFASAMLTAATIAFAPVTVQAEEAHVAPVKEFISQNVEAWLTDPVVVGAIKEQNAKTSGLDEAAIDKLDKEWRAQATAADKPFVNEVLARELSKFLMGEEGWQPGHDHGNVRDGRQGPQCRPERCYFRLLAG